MTRFEIQDIVRQNQNGVTFRALDKKTDEIVSLRRFFPFGQENEDNEDEEGGAGLNPQEGKAFSSACKKLSKVEHPALRKTIFGDTDPIDGMPYLVTEWVEGESLSDVLGNNTMDPTMIIGLVRQALDVCLILSKSLENEAIWIDTKLESIIVSNPEETPKFSFRICPFKWLGTQSHTRDLTGIVSLVEALMGWNSKPVSDIAGLGLGGWLKQLRQNPQMGIDDALLLLPDTAAKLTADTKTASGSNQPVQQPYILANANQSLFTIKRISIMALSACFTGALIFFLYQQNSKKSDATAHNDGDKNSIVEQQSSTTEILPIIDTTKLIVETTTPKRKLWSPSEIPTAAWYDASNTATITSSNGLVSQWNDISGNENHATQSTSALKPQTGSRTINDLNAIDFNADKLNRVELDMTGKAIFAVVLADNTGDGGQIFSHSKINNQMRVVAGGQIRYAASPSHYDNSRASNDTLSMKKPGLAGFILNSTMQYSVNGVFDDTLASKRGTVGTLFNQFGAREENTEGLDGLIGEIIITDSIPDTDTRQKIEGYLAHKWSLTESLPADHLHKLSAPVSLSSDPESHKDLPKIKIVPPKTEPVPPNLTLWSPAEIPSTAWYDASTATFKDGKVSIVNAGSGGGAISGPASLAANGIGNLQAVQLNGTNQYLTGDCNNKGTSLTVFFVGKSLNTNQAPFAGMMSIWENSQTFDWNNAGSAVLFSQNGTLVNSIYTHRIKPLSSATGKLTTDFLASVVFNGSTHTFYLNGTPSTAVPSTNSFNADKVILGARWQNSAIAGPYWNGSVGEVIICNADLSTSDRQKIEGYLAHKWSLLGSLPADHPYKSSSPAPSLSEAEITNKLPPTEKNTKQPTTIDPKNASWLPSNIIPAAWYDAADSNTITVSSGVVTEWQDKSGNGRHATQVTKAGQPAYVSSSLNGLNTVDFDGADDIMKVTGSFAVGNIFAVVNAEETGTTFSGWRWIFGSGKPRVPALFGVTNMANIASDITGKDANLSPIINGTSSGNFSPMATFKVISMKAPSASVSSSAWNLGGGDASWNGKIAELIITSESISDADSQKIEGYLAHKWALTGNLPADHPYKLSTPNYSISKTEPPKPKIDPPEQKPDPPKTEPTPIIKSWSPIEIPTTAWYDATDALTITAKSSAVSQWRDKSGNALHLSQVTAANQPATGAKINGRDALDFTDDLMTTASNPFGATVSDAFVIVVHKVDSIQNGSLFSLTGSVADANRWGSHAPYVDGALYFDCGGVVAKNRVGTSYGVSAGNVVLSSFYCSTTNNVQQVYKNGSLLVGDSSGHAVSTVGNISVGGVTTWYQDTTIGEFIIINGTVDDSTRQKLEGYLAHKWATTASLPANHPYKLSAPSATSQILDVLTPQNTEYIKTLKDGEPVTLQGIVRSAKFSSTEKSIYISFSDPVVETDIRVVIHGSDYEGGPFTEEEFAKIIGRDIVFNGAVYTEKFNEKPPFVKITAKEQIKRATQESTQNKPATITIPGPTTSKSDPVANIPILVPNDIEGIAKLKLEQPAAVKGIVKFVKIPKPGFGLYISFSDPMDAKQINVVLYPKPFEGGPYDDAQFKKIEEEYQQLVGKTVTFHGNVHRQKDKSEPHFIYVGNRDQIKIEDQQQKTAVEPTKAIYTPEDINKIKLLEEKSPIKLVGILNDAKMNASRNAIIFNFSKGQIYGVVNKLSFKDDFDPKSFNKFVGKKIVLDGVLTNDRSKDLYLIEIDELSDISIAPK